MLTIKLDCIEVLNLRHTMKKLSLVLISLGFFIVSKAQITKGNWLFGGNISLSNEKDKNDFGTQLNQTEFEISGNAGYFFINKLAAGLRPDFFFAKTKTNVNTLKQNNSSVGPFVRYYFLSAENRVNLFLDGGYAYGFYKVTSQDNVASNTFYFFAGPVIFLNSVVGLELSLGYRTTKFQDNIHNSRNIMQAKIGLQFHLEKE
jgi:hypothetical protein